MNQTMIEYEQERERQAFRERVNPYANPFGSLPSDYDLYYNLRGTCKGCRRVTWLCRRDRRCRKYAATPVKGYIAMPTGFQKPNVVLSGNGETEQQLVGIRDALLTLGITGDSLFARIREDLERGLIRSARTKLNFVDKIVNANAESEVSE